jgi:glycosyltransferase involved in cell wall biosynthesis
MRDSGDLKRFFVKSYLRTSTEYTHHMLRNRTGERDFRRVIIVGALSRNNGIASGARLQWNTLRQLGVDVDILDATPALRDPLFRIPHDPGSAYIFHSDGPQTACLIRSVLPHAATAYRVAYWAWELPDPPEDWRGCDRNVSEIWTPSTYARSGLSRLGKKPVEVVPHYIPAVPTRKRRADGPFTVLAMADSRSSFTRKNPAGALRAFRMAFGASKSARLLLKLTTRCASERREVETVLGDLTDPNVEIISEFLTPTALTALYRDADILLSLHRAEGFGLSMLEAMANGVPVVATGWSGNLEFMGPSDSRLVPHRLIPVDDASGVYRRSMWADPDLEAAANALRELAADPQAYARLAAMAHGRVSSTYPRFPFALPDDRAAIGRSEVYA